MVGIYCTLIQHKRKSFDSVPAEFKEAVESRLKELGYDTNGDPIE